jgi:syntaxin-binding protein 1
MAGGATYSESRVCYTVSREFSKDVYLASSHMTDPSLFLAQVGDLSVDRSRLDLPADRPKPRAPEHLMESDVPAFHIIPQPPTASLGTMSLNERGEIGRSNAPNDTISPDGGHSLPSLPRNALPPGKITKELKERKRGFFKKF